MPRYSISDTIDMRCCVMAQNRPSTSFKVEPAIGERARNALRHQIHRAHAVGDLAEIGLGDADDRGCAALQAFHHAASGVNTGIGSSSPPGRCTRNFTRMPILHGVGRDVLDAAHQAEAFVAVDQRHVERRALGRMHHGRRRCTVPRPWLTRHSSLSLPVNGQITRGKNTARFASGLNW